MANFGSHYTHERYPRRRRTIRDLGIKGAALEMIRRHGADAELQARHREDAARTDATASFWQQVGQMIGPLYLSQLLLQPHRNDESLLGALSRYATNRCEVCGKTEQMTRKPVFDYAGKGRFHTACFKIRREARTWVKEIR